LFDLVRQSFAKIKDHRPMNVTIPLVDALMSALAMFAFKDPSLLAFDERRARGENLEQVFGIEQIPSDTQMRKIVDGVEPASLRPLFKEVFSQLQRGKVLEQMVFMAGHYLVSLDGTKYFTSQNIHCPSCLERANSKSGIITYSHQMLGAALVHPDRQEVIPLAPEPIIRQDGQEKNDCERNAAKRFLVHLRQDHPRLPLIIVEDALYANAPHIEELQRLNLRFIIGVKLGDHKYLFAHVAQAQAEGRVTEFEIKSGDILHRFRFLNDAPLNESNQDTRVNFLEYWEIRGDKVQHFTWPANFFKPPGARWAVNVACGSGCALSFTNCPLPP
jgi:hypothetical protein